LENKNISLLDYFVITIKWKKFLITLFLATLILSYISIYFLIDEVFEATALIIPSEDKESTGLASLMKNFGSLPLGLSGQKNSEIDMYKTIIYSRSNLENIMKKFDIFKQYKRKTVDETLKELKKNIKADVTEEDAFTITVRDNSRFKAAEMTNYIVSLLNQRIIELNIDKSRDNRIFLEKRYEEIKLDLRNAEDALKNYQEKSGVFSAEEQIKATIEAYASLESQLASKKVELSVYQKILGSESPQSKNMEVSVNEFQKMVEKVQKEGQSKDLIMPIASMPEKAIEYFRYYRDVRIYNEILEFLVPLYEQAKFDEQKTTPILRVVDYAVPPEKRVFPQRTLFSLIIALGATLLGFCYVLIQENKNLQESEKLQFIKRNLFSWRIK
jgi:uncharacterized protein involved in exopolysaccharide biosynthesis